MFLSTTRLLFVGLFLNLYFLLFWGQAPFKIASTSLICTQMGECRRPSTLILVRWSFQGSMCLQKQGGRNVFSKVFALLRVPSPSCQLSVYLLIKQKILQRFQYLGMEETSPVVGDHNLLALHSLCCGTQQQQQQQPWRNAQDWHLQKQIALHCSLAFGYMRL